MVAVKAGDVDAALRRIEPRIVLLLVYGPDEGLVGERAKAAAESAVDDPTDPFQLIRIDGDTLAADPARLADEASTMGLFGARRAIWVRPTSRNLAPAVEALLAAPVADTRVVIEAGDLAKNAPVRTLCERSPKALALPCYADSERGLADLIDTTLRAQGFSIDRDARAVLLSQVGGDRRATRAELDKLTLYAHGRRAITVEDVEAVTSDVAGLALDAVIDAAFQGRLPALETGYRRLMAEGVFPAMVLSAVLRHALNLLAYRQEVEAGRSVSDVVESWRGLHFRRKAAVEAQLGRWSANALKGVISELQAAILATRRMAGLDATLAARLLFEIGTGAAARAGR